MLVEDEALIALNEIRILEDAEFSVFHCFTGEEAVAVFESEKVFDLILMDIDLGPGIDGTQAAKSILESREVPIVFLTSHNEKAMVDKVKNITRYGYVIKNSGRFVLIESINMALELFKAHSNLKKNEIENQEIVDGIRNAILKFDENGKILYFSKGAEEIFGYQAEEVLGKLSIETINPEIDTDGNSHSEMMKNIFRKIENYTINKNENRTKTGRRLWMKWFNKAVIDHNGKQMYILAIGEDITNFQAMLEKLKHSESLFRSAFNNTPAMMSVTKVKDGTYIAVNDSFVDQTGYSREDCIGKTSTEIGLISIDERRRRLNDLGEDQNILKSELVIKCKSGHQKKCNLTGTIIEIDGERQLLSIATEV